MVRIAIVEDEQRVREQLKAYIAQYAQEHDIEFEMTAFADGDEILEEYRPLYDIIFMDIEMKHLNGMETAHRLRTMDDAAIIIFITNTAQYAIGGYAVGALDYVLKPVSYFSFSQRIQKALTQLQKRARFDLTLPVDGGMHRLDTASIYYIESDGHYVHFYTESGDFTVRSTLKELEERLTGRPFARCSNSFLVNLARVSGVRQENVKVGPYQLTLSRTRRKSFLDAMVEYIDTGITQ